MLSRLFLVLSLIIGGCLINQHIQKESESPVQSQPQKQHKFTNRLINEKSPYLLQHAHNPVDWYPWSDEAFEIAKRENKPIFLSIGYATCHWCHVMEHESFENEDIARLMNESFINIKVDREERPDVDTVYMTAVQKMTGQGGWPMSVFLTHERKPFYGGTYFPPTAKWGRPGFTEILKGLANAWNEDREKVESLSDELAKDIASQLSVNPGQMGDGATLARAGEQFKHSYDPEYGGFSPHTKFPRPHSFQLLLRISEREQDKNHLEMVENTLNHIADGGIHDHLGGGFARYSVDREWLVPHFEKMLYDQALLALAYLETYQITGNELYKKTTEDIFTYVLRDMTDPQGGFYSAEDADSEGVEGKFYVWSQEEIIEHLGEEKGNRFCAYYDVTKEGNFEGHNILNRPRALVDVAKELNISPEELSEELEESREVLFNIREKRIHPLKDDKVLTAWNGLMIGALAKGARVFDEPKYSEAARRSAEFILKELQSNGRLLRRWREGEAKLLGYVDDYAFMSFGLTELYFATGETPWLSEALRLSRETLNLFWDPEEGGLTFSGRDGEKLIAEAKEIYDGAIPSGNSVSAYNFARLGHLTGDEDLKSHAQKILEVFSGQIKDQEINYPFMLLALDFLLGPNQEIVISGNSQEAGYQEMLREINQVWLPRAVVVHHKESDEEIKKLVSFVKEQVALNKKSTVYICSNYSCQLPTDDLDELKKQLKPK